MPYRDDRPALEARRDALRAELTDLTRKAEALAEAVRDQEAVERELAMVEGRLSRMSPTRLPLLENLRVASPCSASWDEMAGDERVRFCPSCEKNVYNLSAMASADAERLLADHEGSICVRLYRRADGTVMTTDCPVGVRRKRVKRAVVAVAGASVAAAAATFVQTTGMVREPGWATSAPAYGVPMTIGAPEGPTSVPIMGTAPVPNPPEPVVPRPQMQQGRPPPPRER